MILVWGMDELWKSIIFVYVVIDLYIYILVYIDYGLCI